MRERRRASDRERAAREQSARETARTVFSRFIILTLCAAIILGTLAFGTVHSWSLAVFQSFAALVLVLWTADAWRTRRLRVSKNLLQLPLIGLFVLGLAQILPLAPAATEATAQGFASEAARTLSLDPYATRFVLVQLGALIVYFAAALAFIDSPRRLRLIVRTLIIFGFALALFGLIQYFVSPQKIFGLRETKQSIGFGPFINRHHFANYMLMAAGLPLGLLFAGAVEPDRRLIYGFAAAIMGVALVMTNSRGGILSFLALIFFVAIVSGLLRGRVRPDEEEGGRGALARRLLLRASAGALVVTALLAGALLFGGEESLNRLLGTVNAEDPTTGRLHFWRGTLEVVSERPFIGAGLGAFGVAYTPHDTSDGSIYRLEQAHNDYLQLLADGGIVAFALGIVFVVALFAGALKRMQSESALRRGVALGALAGCFASLVHSFFDFPLHTAANGLLFLTLSALATMNGRTEHPHKRPRRSARDGRRKRAAGTSSPAAAAATTTTRAEGSAARTTEADAISDDASE